VLIPRTVDKQVRKRASRLLILAALSRIEPSPTTLIWLKGLLYHPEWYWTSCDSRVVDQLPVASRAQQPDWYIGVDDLSREVWTIHWLLRNRNYVRQYLVLGGRLDIPVKRDDFHTIISFFPDWKDNLPFVDRDVNVKLWEQRPEELILMKWEAVAPVWSKWYQGRWKTVVETRYGLTSSLISMMKKALKWLKKAPCYCDRMGRIPKDERILSEKDAISACIGEVVMQVRLFRALLNGESNYIHFKYQKVLKLFIEILKESAARRDRCGPRVNCECVDPGEGLGFDFRWIGEVFNLFPVIAARASMMGLNLDLPSFRDNARIADSISSRPSLLPVRLPALASLASQYKELELQDQRKALRERVRRRLQRNILCGDGPLRNELEDGDVSPRDPVCRRMVVGVGEIDEGEERGNRSTRRSKGTNSRRTNIQGNGTRIGTSLGNM